MAKAGVPALALLLLRAGGASATAPAPWHILGNCTSDAEGCVTSPNHPGLYPAGSHCIIRPAKGWRVHVAEWDVQNEIWDGVGNDRLEIAGAIRWYLLNEIPDPGAHPLAFTLFMDLEWTADHDEFRGTGFKLCPELEPEPNTAMPAGGDDHQGARGNGRGCGDYFPSSSADTDYWMNPPSDCHLTCPEGMTLQCHSNVAGPDSWLWPHGFPYLCPPNHKEQAAGCNERWCGSGWNRCCTCKPVTTTQTATTTSSSTSTTTTTQLSKAWMDVNGGVNRACRGGSASDNSEDHYEVRAPVPSLPACRALCEQEQPRCKGVEYSERFARCELWTREAGIFATAPAPGFACQRYGWPVQLLQLEEHHSGWTQYACRGDSKEDNAASYYLVFGSSGLEDCQARCAAAEACYGVEHHEETGRCEVWHRPIRSRWAARGYRCYRFEEGVPGPSLLP